MKIRILLLPMLLFSASASRAAGDPPPVDTALEKKLDSLVSQMSLADKISVIHGRMDVLALKPLNIHRLRMADGTVGVTWNNCTAYPATSALAASWDTVLVRRVGQAIGRELRDKGGNILLAPCINIVRMPLGGRNFETFGEDPFLTSRLAVSYIQGLQSEKVMATVKHFACNNQEWSRANVNAVVSERALREIYLPGFEAAIKEGHSWSVMSALNRVNGSYCSENKHLLTDILKNDWGFPGFVMSDAGGLHSCAPSINAGHDMGGPDYYYSSDSILPAVKTNLIPQSRIDDMVRRLLRPRLAMGLMGPRPEQGKIPADSFNALALETACRGIVLLKNKGGLLPLSTKTVKTLAVIGPNAAIARTGGWGSSFVPPRYAVSPLDGIKARVRDSVKVVFAQGERLLTSDWSPLSSRYVRAAGKDAAPGFSGEYFNSVDLSGTPALVRHDTTVNFAWDTGAPGPGIKADSFSVRWTGTLTVDTSRTFTFKAWADDGIRLFVNDSLIIDGWRLQGTTDYNGLCALKKGVPCKLRVEYCDIHLGALCRVLWDWPPPAKDTAMINAAARLASASDAAVVFAGLSDSIEGEDHDVPSMAMPGFQKELISAVAAANPRTVVVLTGGTQMLLQPWLESAAALVQSFYLGQETGNALAKMLFGDVDPSAKMPYSYINGPEQSPALRHYPQHDIQAPYSEGVYVGYRYLDNEKLKPAFPFGFGLSYTTFTYENMNVRALGPRRYAVDVTVANTGARTGAEVVQVYVTDVKASVDRPVKELKGFARIELAPGRKGTVTVNLDERSFAFWNTKKAAWSVEPGEFTVLAAASAEDVRLTKTIQVR
jgi:beta-glucosidase